ncbi:conserved hypothetical protein [Ricinus communis]|uniref:Uncharacterized protein n=1 Tax=Ricinus communis TaxID=3988 RepID=B9TM37_RICCO|nr:conserved hypothetical protein [Ricinus communis]
MSLVSEEEKVTGERKPNFVRFPNTNPIVPPLLGAEVEESSGRTHNPIVIWQGKLKVLGVE